MGQLVAIIPLFIALIFDLYNFIVGNLPVLQAVQSIYAVGFFSFGYISISSIISKVSMLGLIGVQTAERKILKGKIAIQTGVVGIIISLICVVLFFRGTSI